MIRLWYRYMGTLFATESYAFCPWHRAISSRAGCDGVIERSWLFGKGAVKKLDCQVHCLFLVCHGDKPVAHIDIRIRADVRKQEKNLVGCVVCGINCAALNHRRSLRTGSWFQSKA